MTALPDAEEFRRLALAATDAAGSPLTPKERALVRLGLFSSVVSLHRPGIHESLAEAFREGATPAEVQEVVSVVSGLGVHSLMMTAAAILDQARAAGFDVDGPLTAEQDALWRAKVGDDPFWKAMEFELPGFLEAMLRLSPAQFEAFFDYCAVPWRNGVVRARIKELLAMASDAVPGHRFMPGFRLHLRNAVQLGAGRSELMECLELAEMTPAQEVSPDPDKI